MNYPNLYRDFGHPLRQKFIHEPALAIPLILFVMQTAARVSHLLGA